MKISNKNSLKLDGIDTLVIYKDVGIDLSEYKEGTIIVNWNLVGADNKNSIIETAIFLNYSKFQLKCLRALLYLLRIKSGGYDTTAIKISS